MAAATQPAPNAIRLTAVERVSKIPVVNDSLTTAHDYLLAHGLTARAYALAENVARTGYAYAVPVLGYGKPVIESADGLANKGLDIVESRFPYPFKTNTDQVIADAKKPADQAYEVARGIYDQRIAPLQAQPIVQKAVDSIHVINQQLSATVSGSKKILTEVAGDAGAKLGALQKSLVDGLGEISAQGSTLPSTIQSAVSKSFHDLSSILLAKDKALSERSTEAVTYVKDVLQPILDKAVEILKATKEGVEQKAEEQGVDVEGVKDTAEGKAKEGKAVAQGTAVKASKKTQQAGYEVREKAQSLAQEGQQH